MAKTEIVKLKFRGIDDWNRPVFKDTETKSHYGSADKLFSYEATEKEVIDYFKENLSDLEYFGTYFGCEPNGGLPEGITFEIVQ